MIRPNFHFPSALLFALAVGVGGVAVGETPANEDEARKTKETTTPQPAMICVFYPINKAKGESFQIFSLDGINAVKAWIKNVEDLLASTDDDDDDDDDDDAYGFDALIKLYSRKKDKLPYRTVYVRRDRALGRLLSRDEYADLRRIAARFTEPPDKPYVPVAGERVTTTGQIHAPKDVFQVLEEDREIVLFLPPNAPTDELNGKWVEATGTWTPGETEAMAKQRRLAEEKKSTDKSPKQTSPDTSVRSATRPKIQVDSYRILSDRPPKKTRGKISPAAPEPAWGRAVNDLRAGLRSFPEDQTRCSSDQPLQFTVTVKNESKEKATLFDAAFPYNWKITLVSFNKEVTWHASYPCKDRATDKHLELPPGATADVPLTVHYFHETFSPEKRSAVDLKRFPWKGSWFVTAEYEYNDADHPQSKPDPYWRGKLTTEPVEIEIVASQENGNSSLEKSVAQQAADRRWETMLYDLGSFPSARLSQPHQNRGKSGQVYYSKHSRCDVNGWLHPFWVNHFLTDEELRHNELPKPPLTFEAYAAMLDAAEYKKTRSPLLFAAMTMALDQMRRRQIPVKDPTPIVKIYEAKIGLDASALTLLDGKLSVEKVKALLAEYRDPKLIPLLPHPEAGEDEYIKWLETQADDEEWGWNARRVLHRRLYDLNPPGRREQWRAFLLAGAPQAQEWPVRMFLYRDLTAFKDAEAVRVINAALLNEPYTDCRESILDHLRKHNAAVQYLDALRLIAEGKDVVHYRAIPSLHSALWGLGLRQHLEWAQTLDDVGEQDKEKIAQILKLLEQRRYHPDRRRPRALEKDARLTPGSGNMSL
jgi:hypothetical protein